MPIPAHEDVMLPALQMLADGVAHQRRAITDAMAAHFRLTEAERASMNSWEDTDFVAAVKATGRKKLIMTALWTEVCLTFPSLDAMKEGYEVYPVVDAVGGTSLDAHRAGLERIGQAGGHPISWVSLLCELQRDWNREQTAKAFGELLFAV
jgi:nicotinamidase-related amidase